MNNIKAVLFDSGRVLNGPATGHWFITPNFWEYVDKKKFDSIDEQKIALAFKKADEYVMTQRSITTKEEEFEHFIKFYEIFSSLLPELNIKEETIKAIAKDLVFNPDKYIFYDDALTAVHEFSKNYKLAIVSDAWPSLLDVYDKNGLIPFFDSIVISSILGTSKPDRKMYITALEELKIKPGEAVFVDDSIKNCLGAMNVGIKSILLCRDRKAYLIEKVKSIGKGYRVIHNLNQLKNII